MHGEATLSLIVLMKSLDEPREDDPFDLRPQPQIRVLRLDRSHDRPELVVEIWRPESGKTEKEKPEWVLVESVSPKRAGAQEETPCYDDSVKNMLLPR